MLGIAAIMLRDQRPEKPTALEPPVRRNRAAAVGLDAGRLGRAAFERAGFAEPGLVLRWKEIVGPEVARIAQPIRLSDGPSGGVLTLKADPAAALFLQHETRTLCARINTYLGRTAVQRLRFVPSEIAPPSLALPPARPRDVAAHDPAHNFSGAEPLKAALLKLARSRGPQSADTGD